ncbi:MAG: bile acid:sodium symporter [Ketobacteraceae bacterium]|nr:bile acid:sodium symporter [Ketobacteraceae bacterium]
MFTFYLHYEYWFAAVQLILAMLGMGATLTLKDFRDVLVEPKAVSTGLLIQLVAIPLVTFLLIQGLDLHPGVAVGFAIIAAVPGGTVSNIFTHFSFGNTALSISLTGVTTLACLVTTPFILELLIAPYMPEDFSMPAARVALEIGAFLLLPLFVGMLFLRVFPVHADTFSRYCIRGCLLVILLIVIGSLGAGRLDFQAFGIINILLVAGLIGVFALLSRPFCRLLNLPHADLTAIEMEVVVRNINLGFLIKASLFPVVVGQSDPIGDMVLFTLLVFGGLELATGALIVWLHRRQKAMQAGAGSNAE